MATPTAANPVTIAPMAEASGLLARLRVFAISCSFSVAAADSSAVDIPFFSWYNSFDNLITLCVAGDGDEPPRLNKIIGCESRTVPPLYVQGMLFLAKASHWETGKAEACRGRSPQLYESEDLHIGLLPLPACLWAKCFVAEKRLRHLL